MKQDQSFTQTSNNPSCSTVPHDQNLTLILIQAASQTSSNDSTHHLKKSFQHQFKKIYKSRNEQNRKSWPNVVQISER